MTQFSQKAKIINLLIELGLLANLIFVPLYFNIITFHTWSLNKQVLCQVLTEIIFFFWLLKFLFFKENLPSVKYFLPVLPFLFVIGLATLFSYAPRWSFFGSFERKMGLLTWGHFFLFFFVLVSYLKESPQNFQKVILAILVSGALASFYGFVQFFGFDPFQWDEPGFYGGRVFSSLGQPNFYGSWLLFLLPLTLYSFFSSQKFLIKFFLGLLFFALLANLILSQSRGAWLGLVAGIFFFLFIEGIFRKKKWLSLGVIGVIFLTLIFFIFLNLNPPEISKVSSPILARVLSFGNLFSGSGKIRLFWWKISLNLIWQKPILGWGPEVLRLIFPSYYEPEFSIYEMINSYPDRAHNDILDTLLASGILGLLSYLFLLGSLFYFGLRFYFKSSVSHFKFLIPFLLTGLFAYLVSLQFSFHVIDTALYFWVLAGMIVVISNFELPAPKPSPVSQSSQFFKIFNFKPLLLIFSIILFLFSLWHFNFRPILADFYFTKAVRARIHDDWPRVLENYQKVFSFSPSESFYRQSFAQTLMDSLEFYRDPKTKEKILALAISNIEQIPPQERTFEIKAYKARILSLKFNLSQAEKDFSLAEEAFQEVAKISPRMAGIYNDWAGLYVFKKDWPAVISQCHKALALYPNLTHPELNEEHRKYIVSEMLQVLEKESLAYFELKQYDEALGIYQKILHLDPWKITFQKKIADIYYLKGDLEQALKHNLHGWVLNPQDSAWPFAIALLYKEKGEFGKAREFGQQALSLAPENKEIKKFLEELK